MYLWNESTGALYLWEGLAYNAAGHNLTYTPYPIAASGWNTNTPLTLQAADINGDGTPDLWAISSTGAATAYTFNGSTLTTGPVTTLSSPSDDWPLTEGHGTTAADQVAGQNAAFSAAGATRDASDPLFHSIVDLDGLAGYLTPSPSTIPSGDRTPSISIWFKTSTNSGDLISVQNQAVSAGSTIQNSYNPVMYIGADGKLNAAWYPSNPLTITSLRAVDDGLWHHAVLTASGGTETLYIDGTRQNSATGTPTSPSLIPLTSPSAPDTTAATGPMR